MIIRYSLSLVVLLAIQICIISANDELVIKSDQGKLLGKYLETRNGRKIRGFMSIPYAEPPLGDLRFMAPVPGKKWDGTLDATVVHAVCPQRNIYTRSHVIEGDEDCLYLNVYTPQKQDITKPLPVMMFLHGGGFLCGSGNYYWYGPDILLDRDVILVVPNYRLGALGFISTGDMVLPGNNGLKDQNLALKWIKDNIEFFGGDPQNINIFGESAGGTATHMHMMSPLSKNLFQTAISQSGTSLAPWTLAPPGEALANAHKLAELLNCPTVSSRAILDCLRTMKTYRMIELDKMFMGWDFDPMTPFKPVVEPEHEGAFLSEHPEEIIKSGKIANIPWMLGVTQSDGALRAGAILVEPHLTEQINDDFERIGPITLMYDKTARNVGKVTQKIKDFYFGDKRIDRGTQQQLVDVFTDAWFFNSTASAIRLHRKYIKNNMYLYLFAHRGVASFTSIFGDPHTDYGVCHADDLQYLFPVGDFLFPDKKPDDADKTVAKHMTTLWTNFAKFGNPNGDGSKAAEWTAVNDDLEYYHLATPEKSVMQSQLFLERANFWATVDSENEITKDEL